MYFYKDIEYLNDRNKEEKDYGKRIESIMTDLLEDVRQIASLNVKKSAILMQQ